MHLSKDVAPEDIDKALYEIDELCQRFHDSLSNDKRRFVERYRKAEMCVGIEVRFKKDRSANFVAIFERKRRLVLRQIDGTAVRIGQYIKCNVGNACAGRNYSPMFVGNVEVIELPENVPLASTIRLQPAEQFFNIRPDSLEEDFSFLIDEKVRRVPAYWEIDFSQYIFPRVGVGPKDELIGETIQRAAQVMNDIPDKSAEFSGDIFYDANAIDFYSGLRLYIGVDSISLGIQERLHSIFEVVKMFVGPVDLYPTTEERITVHGQA